MLRRNLIELPRRALAVILILVNVDIEQVILSRLVLLGDLRTIPRLELLKVLVPRIVFSDLLFHSIDKLVRSIDIDEGPLHSRGAPHDALLP